MLTAEQIAQNYETFVSNIKTYVSSPRKEQLLDLYKSLEDVLVLAPASSKASFHNSFAGGYVDHINRVVQCAIDMHNTWKLSGARTETYTMEELVFSAINHDLGKLGLDGKPRYILNDSEWHVKNQGANYKPNAELPFLPVQDNSLFILQSAGIQLTVNEYIAIKIHDGLYDDGNKAYLISGQNESKLRSCLPLILHQADMMASRIEWEREWLDKVNEGPKKEPSKASTYTKPAAQAAKLKSIATKNGSNSFMNALKNI